MEFYDIATITGAGYSNSLKSYSYVDSNPIIGRSFYWLNATDFDGSSEYFNIVTVKFDNRFVKVYPNTLTKLQPINLTVSIESHEVAITLFSSHGLKILNQKFSPGIHTLSHPPLSSGLYLLLIEYPGVSKTLKLTIEEYCLSE